MIDLSPIWSTRPPRRLVALFSGHFFRRREFTAVRRLLFAAVKALQNPTGKALIRMTLQARSDARAHFFSIADALDAGVRGYSSVESPGFLKSSKKARRCS